MTSHNLQILVRFRTVLRKRLSPPRPRHRQSSYFIFPHDLHVVPELFITNLQSHHVPPQPAQQLQSSQRERFTLFTRIILLFAVFIIPYNFSRVDPAQKQWPSL